MSSKLPKLVLDMTFAHDAWIVGSGADPENTNPRDYDVIVPFSKWREAAMLIPDDAKRNHFGGWKCISEGVEVDVWGGEISYIMTHHSCNWVWHPHTGIRFKKQ